MVIEHEAVGGQAGTSSMIRNYPGFSQGISGARLAQETWRQAWAFGTTFVYMRQAEALSGSDGRYRLQLSDSQVLTARAVIIATGVTYRRLGIPALEDLQGRAYLTAPRPARPRPCAGTPCSSPRAATPPGRPRCTWPSGPNR